MRVSLFLFGILVVALACGCVSEKADTTSTTSSTEAASEKSRGEWINLSAVACGDSICPEGFTCLNPRYGLCVVETTTTTHKEPEIRSTTTTSTSLSSTTTSLATGFDRLFERITDKYKSTLTTSSTATTTTGSKATTTTIEGITPAYDNRYVMGEDGYWGGRTD